MHRKFKVALIQTSMMPDPAANLGKAMMRVEEAAGNGAQIVCLPELFCLQYFCQKEDPALFDLAEPLPGSSTEQFGRLAAKLGIVVIVPVFERRAAGLYHNFMEWWTSIGSRRSGATGHSCATGESTPMKELPVVF